MKTFTQEQLEGIAKALGDTDIGFTGSEIGQLLQIFQIQDINPNDTKRVRLYHAFAAHLDKTNDHSVIQKFIKHAMFPNRHVDNPLRYEAMRQYLNEALSFAGLAVDQIGEIIPIKVARTLSDAEERARALRTNLEFRGVHPEVLKFCRAQLLENNYFHAVLEATKSIADRLRRLTGLKDDGSILADRALGFSPDKPPMFAINDFQTESDKSEQRGFYYLVKGTFSMFRNPLAHEPRIQRVVDKIDAEDLLSLASLIHRRFDKATMLSRTQTDSSMLRWRDVGLTTKPIS